MLDRDERPLLVISFGLLAFLFLSSFIPWNEVPKAFIFIAVIPGVIWTLVKGRSDFYSMRYLWGAFGLLLVYLVISSVFFSDNEAKQIIRRVRWVIEVAFFSMAVFLATPLWVKNAAQYARLFLIAICVICISAIIGFEFIGLETVASLGDDLVTLKYGGRLTWFGLLDHPIKGPSVVVVLYAIALTLSLITDKKRLVDVFLLFLASISLLILCFLSGSRGPLGSLIIYMIAVFLLQIIVQPSKNKWLIIAGVIAICIVTYAALSSVLDVERTVIGFINKADSYRFILWSVVFENVSDSLWFGGGVATEFIDTKAGTALVAHFGSNMHHAHNLFMHLLVMGGLLGLILFFVFLFFLIRKLIMLPLTMSHKLYAFFVLLVMLLLNATEGYRLISSPGTDWVVVWLPLFFILGFALEQSIHDDKRKVSENG